MDRYYVSLEKEILDKTATPEDEDTISKDTSAFEQPDSGLVTKSDTPQNWQDGNGDKFSERIGNLRYKSHKSDFFDFFEESGQESISSHPSA